jgi:exodeoxyribonuclease-3
MQIATWNINGVKARLETALAWLREAKPDVACLQEIKSVDEAFPKGPFEDLGYNVHTHGQKGFNGVAILSLRPLEDVSARSARRRCRRAGQIP